LIEAFLTGRHEADEDRKKLKIDRSNMKDMNGGSLFLLFLM
jgi:hypothetical protein